MFDDEVCCFRKCRSGQYDVETTLENYKIDSENRTYYVDGNKQTMTMDGTEIAYDNAKTFHMSGNVEDSRMLVLFPKQLRY